MSSERATTWCSFLMDDDHHHHHHHHVKQCGAEAKFKIWIQEMLGSNLGEGTGYPDILVVSLITLGK
jgi:hypothetical protein